MLSEIHELACDSLISMSLVLIQQGLLRLFLEQLGAAAWGTSRFVVRHAYDFSSPISVMLNLSSSLRLTLSRPPWWACSFFWLSLTRTRYCLCTLQSTHARSCT